MCCYNLQSVLFELIFCQFSHDAIGCEEYEDD